MDLDAKLLKGSAIEVCGLQIEPLTIGEIVDDIGYERYVELLSLLLINKNRIIHLFDNDEFKNKLRNFDLFLMDDGLVEKLVEFFKVFLKKDDVKFFKDIMNIVVTDEDRNEIVINRDNYDDLVNVLRLMYWVQEEKKEEYKPANKKAEEFIKKLEEKNKAYAKVKTKVGKSLFDVISGVAWKAPNMNIFEIWDLTIYQLYDAYYRIDVIDEYDRFFTGVYSGAIDTKKVDMKNYDWTKKLKQK